MASKRARPCTRGAVFDPHALHTSYRRRVSAVTSDGRSVRCADSLPTRLLLASRPKAPVEAANTPHLVDVLNWRSLSAFSCPKPGQSGGEPSRDRSRRQSLMAKPRVTPEPVNAAVPWLVQRLYARSRVRHPHAFQNSLRHGHSHRLARARHWRDCWNLFSVSSGAAAVARGSGSIRNRERLQQHLMKH